MKPTDLSQRDYKLDARLTRQTSARTHRPSRLPVVTETTRFGRYLGRLRWIFGR